MNNEQLCKKRKLGQFFTLKRTWLLPHIKLFINKSGCSTIYDPFAGSGCLIEAVINEIESISKSVGLDIDSSLNLNWRNNDSLKNIPHIPEAIIVTNPPYISNYSAKRKKINLELEKYFHNSVYDDIYLIALDRMLEAQNMVVAIIPETFINSNYKQKNKLSSITILEENPFEDTTTPVIIACFDSVIKDFNSIPIYKNAHRICTFEDVIRCRMQPMNSLKLTFNDICGWLAVRCVDTTDPQSTIMFGFKENFSYDWDSNIKTSSRLFTLIDIDIPLEFRHQFIIKCNMLLNELRINSYDIVLSPFKGNMKNGVRRRRLDFKTCRAIIEKAYYELGLKDASQQLTFF